jgi:signal transduction histidine kinase
VKLGIKDDGMGFDLAAVRARRPDSLGLTGMQERAELAGGRAEVTSAPGKGTRISAVFPVVAAGAAAMKGPT